MILSDLHLAIQAVCPIHGLSLVAPNTVTIDYNGATAQQQTDAQTVVAAWDWSASADATRDAQRIKAQATTGIDTGQLQSGTAWERGLRSAVLMILDELNILRAAIPHPIVSITRSGTTATATTPSAHGLIVGGPFAIHGATLAAYNVAGTVATVPSPTTFTYPVAGSLATPATGSLSYTLGAVPQTSPRTPLQALNAYKAKVAATAE